MYSLLKTLILLNLFILLNVYGQISVSIPDTSKESGKSIKIPIYVSDLTNQKIWSYEFRLHYDKSILKAKSIIDNGTLSDKKSWDIDAYLVNDGLVVQADGRYYLTGSGKLLIIKFEVIAEEGYSDLTFDFFDFNYGSPTSNATNGSFRVYVEKLVKFSKVGNGGGQVELEGEKYSLPFERELVHGKAYTIKAYPDENSKFDSWEDGINSTENPYTFEVKNDIEIKTRFSIEDKQVTANILPEGSGNVSGSGIYKYGATAKLHAKPFFGKEFINWTINGNEVSKDSVYEFKVYSDVNITANFSNKLFQIVTTTNPIDAGQITGAGYFHLNQIANITVVENENWVFRNWSENGEVISEDSLLIFSVLEDRHLTANFSIITDIENVSEENGFVKNIFLDSPYPNPFNPTTVFRFGLDNQSNVKLYIFDVTGKIVAKIIDSENISIGVHERRFKASKLPSGVYFYHYEAVGESIQSRMIKNGKLILIK